MKKFLCAVVLLLIAATTYSQSTKGFNYQTVVRNSTGTALANQAVTFHILLTNLDGTITHYSENQDVITTEFGVANLVVGEGTVELGTFATIPWGSGDVVMKVEIKLQGSSVFVDMGSVILRPVPLAQYALSGQQGPQGIQGVQGDIGPIGPIGPQGIEGKEGPQGQQGPQGIQGVAGTGLTNKGTWASGSSYIAGDYVFALASSGTLNSMWVCQAVASFVSSTEPKNDLTNWSEFQAPAGPQGEQGIQGLQGVKGDAGPIGLTGATGATGPQGNGISQTINNGDGTYTFKYTDNSQFTTSNLTGPQGVKGDQGIQGIQGPAGTAGTNGVNGISITWLGTLPTRPSSPAINEAYYNSVTKLAEIWNGSSWGTLAKDGATGTTGATGLTGSTGSNGISVNWLGPLALRPSSPTLNQAYYNTVNKISEIWNGSSWNTIAQDGAMGATGAAGSNGSNGINGTNGTNGSNGISISWQGTYTSAPLSPTLNQAYYNSVDKKSYVYTSSGWQIMTLDGATGAQGLQGIQGPLGPQGPQGIQGTAGTGLVNKGNWASGSTYASGDYVFNRSSSNAAVNSMWICQLALTSTTQPYLDLSHWSEFQAPAGPQGVQGIQGIQGVAGAAGSNGISLQWLGSLANAPTSPTLNQAYYNLTSKTSFVYSGGTWNVLAQDGTQGPQGIQGIQGPVGPLVSGTAGQTLYNNGTTWAASSNIFNDGTSVGIGTSLPTQKLDVSGSIRLRSTLYDFNNSAGSLNQILTRSASGVLWQPISTMGITSGTGTSGQVALWNSANSIQGLSNVTWASSLQVASNTGTGILPDDPIFEVRNKDGKIVLGVYQTGVRIYFDDSGLVKGAKGGFAVGGLSNQAKVGSQEYLRITQDSARVYVNQLPAKGAKGGFAVGGLSNKTTTNSFMQLTPQNYFIGHQSGSKTTGLYNSFIGYQAGMSNTTGSSNVFVGYQTGYSNLTGSNNIAVGNLAGYLGTVGASNVFIGDSSGYGNTSNYNVFLGKGTGKANTGQYNAFVGYRAGMKNTSGNSNVFLGYNSGYNNTTSSNNVVIGYESGFAANTSVGGNVLIGYQAGKFNSAFFNSIIGYKAGYSNTGNYNSFFGFSAGLTNTGSYNSFYGPYAGYTNDGTANSFIGYGSGYYNQTGGYNVFMGNYSGFRNTTGSSNVFIGNQSGYNNTTGQFNTALGYQAGYTSNASYNSIIGYQAGYANSTGQYNTFMGYQAGKANTTASSNLFLGYQSGLSNTTGSSNIFLGESSGYSNTTGQHNIFMGRFAGYTGTLLQNNIFIGDSAGYFSNNQFATNNVFLGYAAGKNTQSYNNVFIGNQAGWSNTGGQNNIAIGDNAGFKNTSSQNVFIGTSAGENNTSGYFNIMIGRWTGRNNTTGAQQILIGGGAGGSLTTGGENIMIGNNAGTSNSTGVGNIFLGNWAGWSNTGTKNVFIGYKIGYGSFQTVSNALVIGSDVNPTNPLIYGEFDNKILKFNANVAVNADPISSKFYSYDDRTTAVDDPAIIGEHTLNTTGYGIGVRGIGGWYGVQGLSTVTGTGSRTGVRGNASGGSANYGIYGYASGTSTNYGIYGSASGGTTNYAAYFAGNVTVTGTFSNPSDINLKKNINPLAGSLKKILNLQGVTYEWKSENELANFKKKSDSNRKDEDNSFNFPKGTQIGVIAQDVEKVLPELVQTNSEGIKSVDYIKIIPVLIEAIKDQQKQIEALTQEVEALKAKK
jgi:hypothetical protein